MRTHSLFPRIRCLLLAAALPLALTLSGCAGKAGALRGAPAPANLPDTRIRQAQHIVFNWEYRDRDMVGRGEGVARILPPDSARVDLFLGGGFGSGYALLLGNELLTPGGAFARSMLPPPELLWGALGRVALPPERDTVARIDGNTLRVDIGSDPKWRLAFEGGELTRLERIEGGRVTEWVSRTAGGQVRYSHERGGRSLTITITGTEDVQGFDPSIWRGVTAADPDFGVLAVRLRGGRTPVAYPHSGHSSVR